MKWNHCCNAIFAVLIASLPSTAIASMCDDKEGAGEKPKVSVTLYYVPEKFACRDNGYENGLAQGSPCEEWTIEAFEDKAKRKDYKPVASDVPPSEIKLDELFSDIALYSDGCSNEHKNIYCMDADRRKSIVMIFEVHLDNPEGRQIHLVRLPSRRSKVPGQNEKKIRPHSLQAGGKWITHQRADVFLPSKFFSWCLAIDDWRWILGTKR